MNIELRQPAHAQNTQAKTRLEIVDVDIHPKNTLDDFRPYLSNRWWDYLQTYGRRSRHGFVDGYPFPKMTPIACRRDAWPPGGGGPGSDLGFMQEQHLDTYGIAHGILNPLQPSGQGDVNDALSALTQIKARVDKVPTAADIAKAVVDALPPGQPVDVDDLAAAIVKASGAHAIA